MKSNIYFRKQSEARKYLEELLKKEWFKEKGVEVADIVKKRLANGTAQEIKRIANYWRNSEQIRRNFEMNLN
jgi:hypothetical protein